MQLAERRIHPKRIDVARPLEVVGPSGDDIAGYTRNLSESGVRARFDGRCTVGANLLVRISLEDGALPVEKRARVVWSAPDVYGDGTDVGLRLLSSDEEIDEEPEATSNGVPIISVGTELEVECGGIRLPATVTRVGDITDGGLIQVTLALFEADDRSPSEVEAARFGGAAADEDEDEPVVEKAPIVERAQKCVAELRRLWLRYGLPFTTQAMILLAAFSQKAVILTARVASRLWAKLPDRVRSPAERLWMKTSSPRCFVRRISERSVKWITRQAQKTSHRS
jgi:hypothetical protein